MRKLYPALAAVFFLAVGCSVPVITVKGDYTFLEKNEPLNVRFDYSDMMIGRNLPEDKYVEERVKERNAEEAGKGDTWKEGWYGAREKRYEPKFIEQLNKYLEEVGIVASRNNEDARYTLIVHTIYTEPGFNVGVMRKPAEVNLEYLFVETENPDKIIAKFTHTELPGAQPSGFDYDVGSRVAESYAYGGKYLGKKIIKELE